MCCRTRAMNKVLLSLTTHPSNVSSRLGTLSDATGPFSLLKIVVDKFLMLTPKNCNEKVDFNVTRYFGERMRLT